VSERLHGWPIDVVVVAFVGLVQVGNALDGGHHPLAVAAAAVGAAVLLVRRSRPLLVLAVATAATVALALANLALFAPGLVVAYYGAAAFLPRRLSLRACVVSLALVAVAFAIDGTSTPASSLPMVLFLATAWVFGDNMRVRSERTAREAHDAVARERARIARELHVVVTHSVSVMVVQAAAGNAVFEQQPERAREALGAIEQTGRKALGELRRLLDVVADDEGEGTLPQPGLTRLDELVDRVRTAGLAVDLALEGTPRELPPGVDLSAYRIVQEALTNTLKHAHATRVGVLVRYGADELELRVTDDGVGGTAGPGGRGLVGMRERVALFGGELRAGAEPGGGFAVHARMPLGAT
jgi:signal transduction histidine kinase